MLNLGDSIKTLNKVADILEAQKINYWIDSGTLLSAFKDKTFNIYDHDIDIRYSEIDEESEAELVKQLWKGGFKVIEGGKAMRAQINVLSEFDIMVDLKMSFQDDKHCWYYCWREPDPTTMLHVFPRKFFDTLTTIELHGREYPCPNPIGEYIEYHYGPEWQKFKVRIEEANETDMTWDYMHDPPCSMTLGDFYALQQENPTDIFQSHAQ